MKKRAYVSQRTPMSMEKAINAIDTPITSVMIHRTIVCFVKNYRVLKYREGKRVGVTKLEVRSIGAKKNSHRNPPNRARS